MKPHAESSAFRPRPLAGLALLAVLLAAPRYARAGTETVPLYQVVVNPTSTKAFHFHDPARPTEVLLRGSVLRPEAEGEARVQNRSGAMRIKARFKNLPPASGFGPRYLTYVLWAVTPVGRPVNLGEVIVHKNGRATLEAHSSLQTFGLVVTAEPHYAVTELSSMMVLESQVARSNRGAVEAVEAKFGLRPLGSNVLERAPGSHEPLARNPRVSPYVYQADNAMDLARGAQAEQLAPDAYNKAADLLAKLAGERNQRGQAAVVLARQVIQAAEDARVLAARHQEDARLEQAAREKEAAQREAEAARAAAETARAQAEAARLAAEQETLRAQERSVQAARQERLALGRKLQEQLRRLLPVRETGQGFKATLPGLQFASGKAALRPAAREQLAKVAGILQAYPGLRVVVEGHADSSGSDRLNERLALNRAEAVRTFLTEHGLPPEAVTVRGCGSRLAWTANDSSSGRQQNRRVELILSGEAIGF
jgi:outer membrane protein OmpA-like peptidoglycan-associated protein